MRVILEDGLAGRIRVRQDRGIDVDHHLVAFSRCTGIDAVVERRLRDAGQRVRLLLRHGRRFRGTVLGVHRARPLVQRLAGRGQRLHEHGADLRRQSPADDDHAVFVLIHVQRPDRVAPCGRPRFGLPVHAPPAADDALDVFRGAGLTDREQSLLGFRRGDARQSPNLRVR